MKSYDLAGPDPKPMTVEEIDALKELVRMLSSALLVVQIGGFVGCSTLAILEACPAAFVFSIDIKPHFEELDNVDKAGFAGRVARVLGPSQEIGLGWPVTCDFLYIDGDHRYEFIQQDIRLWVCKLRTGGILAFHDYIPNPGPRIKGRVAQAVDEWQAGSGWQTIMQAGRIKAFRHG